MDFKYGTSYIKTQKYDQISLTYKIYFIRNKTLLDKIFKYLVCEIYHLPSKKDLL